MKVLVSWLRELVDVPVSAHELGQRLHLAGFELAGIEARPQPPHPNPLPASGERGKTAALTNVEILDSLANHDAVIDWEITANRPDCLSMVGIAREVSTLYDTPLRHTPAAFAAPGDSGALGPLRVTIEDAELCPRYTAAIADVTVGPSPAWLVERLAAAGIRSINNIVDLTNYVLIETGQPLHAFDLARLAGPHLRVRRAAADERVKTLDGQTRMLTPEMLVIADADRAQAVAGVMGGADSEVSAGTTTIVIESAYFQPAAVRRTSKRLNLSTEASRRFERGADPEAASSALARACQLIAEIGAGAVRPGWIDVRPGRRVATTVTLRHSRIRRVLGVDVDPDEVLRILRALGFDVANPDQRAPAENPDIVKAEEMQALSDTFGGDGSTSPTMWSDLIAANAEQTPEALTWPQVDRRRSGRDRRRAADDADIVWRVAVPSWRVDVAREIDLVEEVARIHGYAHIPSTFPALTVAPPVQNLRLRRDAHLRSIARALGFSESVTFSFIEREAALRYADTEAVVAIANPLSESFSVMRPALLPGLVASVAHNRRREQHDVRLFELANRFTRARGEHRALALAWTGAATPLHWSGTSRPVDIFDLAGAVSALGDAIGVVLTFAPLAGCGFLTESTASTIQVVSETTAIGVLGQLDPTTADAAGIPSREPVFVAEIDLDAVLDQTELGDRVRATPLPRFPSSVRDLSILVPLGLPAAAIRGTIRESAPATLESVWEFDRYQGRGVPDGACSVSLRLTFRAPDRTLTEADVQTAIDEVVAALGARHAATLR